MEIERRRSKGSFLSLFDCNGVSRKKLVHASPDLPDQLKQAKENMGNMPESQLNTTKVDENGIKPSSTATCGFKCELSASNDMGCETKVPCLVARLMGLDSIPSTSTVDKLAFTASRTSNSLVSSHCHENVVYPMESRAHKSENRTIEARLPENAAIRVLDLKQKPEAAHHASMHKKNVDTTTAKGPRYSGNINGSRGNSTLLTIQAKAHVQCRGTLTSNSSRGHKQKEQNEIASNQFFRSQKPTLRQAMTQRTCTGRNIHHSELGQNMLRHNSAAIKVSRSTSIVESNKPTTRSYTGGARKVKNKNFIIDNVRPNSSGRRATGAIEEFSQIKTKSNSKRKRYPKRGVLSVNVVHNYEGKSIKCNITTEGSMNQDALNKKASKDVISFTFTSPLKKESQPSTHTNNVDVNVPGPRMTDADASSDPFNGKAQDFASRINSLECTLATRMSSAILLPSEVSIESGEGDRHFHADPLSGELQSIHNYACSSSTYDLMLNMNQHRQGSKAIRQHNSGSNIETEYCQGLNTAFASQAAEQVCGLMYTEDYNKPRNLKLEHVADMLSNEKLMERSFSRDQTIRNERVIKTSVFDMLEGWSSTGRQRDGEGRLKVERNILFDFVSEFLEFRRSKGYKGRALESQNWWEEDLCREIKRFKSVQEIMVDELVNMDMSSPHGTWLHFQTEPLQQILLSEIEWDISTSLINDLLLDLLHHN